MSPSHRFAPLGVAVLLLSLFATGARAADPVFTDAWEGVWNVDFVETECGSSDTTDFSGLARMCGGESARFNQGIAFPYTCDGVVTDDSMEMTCTFQTTPFPGCTALYTYTLSATRSGNTMTGTEEFDLSFVGNCGGIEPYCSVTDFDGTRLATNPECTGTPVIPASWSSVKSIFR